MYNASNNELVRTKTLVKGAIIQIDATPFRQWYEQHYGQTIGKKAKTAEGQAAAHADEHKVSAKTQAKIAERAKDHTLDLGLKEQFTSGRLYAAIASRPGQSGRCDGYILEEKELEFYTRKLTKKK